MKNLYLVQANYRFGDNAFLPYSIGQLWAYARKSEKIRSEYELIDIRPFSTNIPAYIDIMSDAPPDIVAISLYIWNRAYSLSLAKAVRAVYPDCTIILGGPDVPKDEGKQIELLEDCADILVHGEGERIFADVLLGVPLTKIDGISWVDGKTMFIGDSKGQRAKSLKSYPSPYTTGVFDDLMEYQPYNWHVLQETNRGCPYQCSFCDWGSATFSQVREFPLQRVIDEHEFCAEHEIELLYNCDANYGMLKRDADLTRNMISTKSEHGYPQKFRAAYAKKTTPRVYHQAKQLAHADMSKGVTLSAQSMHMPTLKAVKRRPIDEPEFRKLMTDYNADGVPTYTEIILGLPLETKASFMQGLARLLELGQHEGINVYPSIMLENSEMNARAYREHYELETTDMPMLLLHGTPDDYTERYDLVTSTSTMSRDDWIECMLFAWVVQALHCLGFLRAWANEQRRLGFRYEGFYEKKIQSARGSFGRIITEERELLIDTMHGLDDWNQIDDDFGQVVFPPEERIFMRCVMNSDEVYSDLGVSSYWAMKCREDYADLSEYDSVEEWARDTVWYSRKGKRRKAA